MTKTTWTVLLGVALLVLGVVVLRRADVDALAPNASAPSDPLIRPELGAVASPSVDSSSASAPPAKSDTERSAIRERLRRARVAKVDVLPVPVGDAETQDYLEQIIATNRQLAEQLEMLDDCFDGHGPSEEVVVASGDLVGEAEVGMLFDEIRLDTDTIGDPDLGECLRQSLLAAELETPKIPHYLHYRFTFDFEEGTARIEAVPTEAQIAETRARFPSLADGPYASILDDEPDDVALGLLPWMRESPL